MSSRGILTTRHRSRWALVLRGLFALVAGIYIIARPFESVAILALVLAVWLLVDGIVHIVHAFDLRDSVPHWWVMLLNGIIGVAFGLGGLYFYPVLTLAYAVIWTTLWLLITGGAAIFVAVQEKRDHLSWVPMLAFGFVSVSVGVLAFVRPAITVAVLTELLAVFGIVGGIALLVSAAKARFPAEDLERPLEYSPGLRRSS